MLLVVAGSPSRERQSIAVVLCSWSRVSLRHGIDVLPPRLSFRGDPSIHCGIHVHNHTTLARLRSQMTACARVTLSPAGPASGITRSMRRGSESLELAAWLRAGHALSVRVCAWMLVVVGSFMWRAHLSSEPPCRCVASSRPRHSPLFQVPVGTLCVAHGVVLADRCGRPEHALVHGAQPVRTRRATPPPQLVGGECTTGAPRGRGFAT